MWSCVWKFHIELETCHRDSERCALTWSSYPQVVCGYQDHEKEPENRHRADDDSHRAPREGDLRRNELQAKQTESGPWACATSDLINISRNSSMSTRRYANEAASGPPQIGETDTKMTRVGQLR
jgi:hypothetical protein